MITVYSASAGSGKTYTLTREYLSLALAKDYKTAYRHILAVTFTNKATGEMKSRILRELKNIISDEAQKHTLCNELIQILGISVQDLQKRADFVLSAILHDYSGFSVSTIDSFFQKIVRNFTREAGLQAGFKLELDQDSVLEAVIQQVLAHLGTPGYDQLDAWVISMAEEKVEQGEKWDFRAEMMALGKQLFRETLMRREEDLEQLNAAHSGFQDHRKKLFADIAVIEKQIQNTAAEILNQFQEAGFSPEDLSYGMSGLGGYIYKTAQGQTDLPGKRVSDMAADAEKWFAKSNKNRNAWITSVHAGILDSVQNFIQLMEHKLPVLITAYEIRKYLNILGLVNFIREELRIYRQEENILLLPDTTLLLFKIIRENEASFIYEKAGNYYRNFLIDEFQDTSRTQWDNFRPLVVNSIASGNKNLLVGDVKQSIYRWRDGDWKLLYGDFQADIHTDLIQKKTLDYNYRSLSGIIEMNNKIFSTIPQVSVLEMGNKIPDEVSEKLQWIEEARGIFTDTIQQIPEKSFHKPSGFSEFNCIESEQSEDSENTDLTWKEISLKYLYQQIQELKEAGFSYAQMSVLTRTKKDGSEILQYLQSGVNGQECIPVSSSEALQVGAGQSVQLLVNALICLIYDKNAPALAALSLQWKYAESPDAWVSAWLEKNKNIIPQEIIEPESRARLRRMPLFDLFHEFIRVFKLDQPEWNHEAAFVSGFMDSVLEFMKEDNPDPELFLEWWEYKGKIRSIQMPDDQDAVRILTIHKSKGLEFPVVLIPYCDWEILPGFHNSPWLWCSPQKAGVSALPLAPVKFRKELSRTFFSKEYFDECRLNYADNLNLLYVAFTRAEQVLRVNLPVLKTRDGSLKPGRMSSLLYQTLEVLSDNSPEFIHFDTARFFAGNLQCVLPEKEIVKFTATELNIHSGAWMDRLRVKKISRLLPARNTEEKKIQYGVLVHALLENVKYKDDTEKALSELVFSGLISVSEVPTLRKRLELLFVHPEIQEWFDGSWEIRNEASILDAEGRIWRPDRIMLKDGKLIIADFKTGMPRIEYADQVRQYAELFSGMGYTQIEAWLVYIHEAGIAPEKVM